MLPPFAEEKFVKTALKDHVSRIRGGVMADILADAS